MDSNSSKKIIRDILPKSSAIKEPKEESEFFKHFRRSDETKAEKSVEIKKIKTSEIKKRKQKFLFLLKNKRVLILLIAALIIAGGIVYALAPASSATVKIAPASKNAVVLDPFIGSGTTAVAAKKIGKNYIGIDSN